MQDLHDAPQEHIKTPELGGLSDLQKLFRNYRCLFLERKLSLGVLEELNCPACDKTWVAEILWGYPKDADSMVDALEKKEVVLGGCVISGHDPRWECNNCQHRWGDAEHNFESDSDSFDFDKGFNLDEVYD